MLSSRIIVSTFYLSDGYEATRALGLGGDLVYAQRVFRKNPMYILYLAFCCFLPWRRISVM